MRMEAVISTLQSAYGDFRFLLLYAACLLAGLIRMKAAQKGGRE